MKPFQMFAAAGLALLIAGCQETTSTGPAPATSGGPPATRSQTEIKKLSLTAAKAQTIKQGDTDDVAIKINRDNFNDAVTIRLNDLPKGVELIGNEAVIPAGQNSITLQLKAAPDAEVGEHKVQIDAKAPGLADNVQTFTLTVKASS
ncbi:MAG: hypothetical protein HY290_22455 [Planctomycetia bacterium]|nr:hypothetical protein [Planctomycetia bacterium]